MLLESFSRDVQREVIGVHDALDEAQVVGHHVFEVVRDEDPPDVELDVLPGLAVLVEGLAGLGVGDEQEGLEGNLVLSYEVRLSDGAIVVLDDRFIKVVSNSYFSSFSII